MNQITKAPVGPPISQTTYENFCYFANRDNSYDNGAGGMKEKTLRTCSAFLRKFAQELGAEQAIAKPNPGGVGVSGDLGLVAMLGGRGFHFFGSADFGYVIRSIDKITDYHGGSNVHLGSLPLLYQDFKEFTARFLDPSVSVHTLGSSFCPSWERNGLKAPPTRASQAELEF